MSSEYKKAMVDFLMYIMVTNKHVKVRDIDLRNKKYVNLNNLHVYF